MNENAVFSSVREASIAIKATKTVLICIIITLLCNTFLSNGLFIFSLNSIISFQSTSTPLTIFIFNLLSFLANTLFVTLVIASLFLHHPIRIRVLVFLSFFILNTYLMTILKAVYHEERPFWYSRSIQQLEWTCPREYGNPSGHSWLVVVLWEPLLEDFWRGKGRMGKVGRWVGLVGLFVGVPFSRMYLGAHSGNQVFFGVLMGVAMVAMYRFSLQRLLYRMFESLIRPLSPVSQRVKPLLFALLAQTLFTLLPILIYLNAPTEDSEYILILNEKCPDRITTSIGLNGGILFTSILISFLFGLIYGLIMSGESTMFYLYGKWEFQGGRGNWNWMGRGAKFGVEVGLLLVPLVVGWVMEGVMEGVVGKYYGFSAVVTLSGYLFMRYSGEVLVRMGVVRISGKLGGLL